MLLTALFQVTLHYRSSQTLYIKQTLLTLNGFIKEKNTKYWLRIFELNSVFDHYKPFQINLLRIVYHQRDINMIVFWSDNMIYTWSFWVKTHDLGSTLEMECKYIILDFVLRNQIDNLTLLWAGILGFLFIIFSPTSYRSAPNTDF